MAGCSRSNSSIEDSPGNFVPTKRLRSNSFFVDPDLAKSTSTKDFAKELGEKWMKVNRSRRLSLGHSPIKRNMASKKRFKHKWINLKDVCIHFFIHHVSDICFIASFYLFFRQVNARCIHDRSQIVIFSSSSLKRVDKRS